MSQNLDLVMSARGIRNGQMAEALGTVRPLTVGRWRRGNQAPKVDEIERLSRALELPLYALLVERPTTERVLKALKTLQGDRSADRGMSIGDAHQIVSHAAIWADLELGDPAKKMLRTLPLDPRIPGSEDAREQDRIQVGRTESTEDLDEQA